jgi:hypothetical protein
VLLSDAPSLEQNVPNPFSQSTVIRYYIPNTVKSATINIYDVKGVRIQHYPIQERGNGELSVKIQNLSAGEYFYELIVDGEKVASKKMVLAGY